MFHINWYLWAISWAIVKALVSPVSSFTLQLVLASHIEPKLAKPRVSHGLSEFKHKSTLENYYIRMNYLFYNLKINKTNFVNKTAKSWWFGWDSGILISFWYLQKFPNVKLAFVFTSKGWLMIILKKYYLFNKNLKKNILLEFHSGLLVLLQQY